MKFPRFNLANRVTILRFLMALLCFISLALLEDEACLQGTVRGAVAWITAVIFTAGTALDALDGYIARRDNTVTAFGRIADPFVDKIMVCGALIFLCATDECRAYLAPWMVVTVLVREFLVTGIRGYMESVGVEFGAELPGKIKMVVQSISIVGLIIVIGHPSQFWPWKILIHTLVWATILSTVWSAANYVIKAARRLGARDI